MARDAQDREDLLRDATAFSHRVELQLIGVEQPVFCGFRDGQAFSLYWTPDDVFQFNCEGEFRRAFWRGRMIACYKQRPHWLKPEGEGRVQLAREPLNESEIGDLTLAVEQAFLELRKALASNTYTVVGAVPEEAGVIDLVAKSIACETLRFALHPGVGRKK